MARLFKFTGIAEEIEWKPTDINGCKLWLRSDLAWQDAAKTIPCTNESLIWTGEDKSGNGNDVPQATEGMRPIYLTNQINGHPVWSFDAVDDFLKKAFTLVQPYTVFVVGKASSDPGNNYFLDGFNGNAGMIRCMGGDIDIYAGNTMHSGLGGPNAYYIICAIFHSTNSWCYVNGTAGGSPGNPGTENPGGITVGNYAGGTVPLNGCIAEVIIYDSHLSDANRQRVELYLNTEAQGNGYAIY